MELKTVIENLDEVEAAYQPLYQENEDGKFYLPLTDIDSHPSVANLKNAYERTKADRKRFMELSKEAQEKLKIIPEDFDPEEWEKYLEEKEKGPPKQDEGPKFEEVRAKLEKKWEDKLNVEVSKRDEKIERLQKFLQKITVEEALTKSLLENNVSKEFIHGAKALLQQKVKILEEDDENNPYVPVFETDMGEIPLGQYVKEWTETDEGKPYVAKPKGSDAPGSSRPVANADNPWIKGNLTQQAQIIRENPSRAEQLKRQAGL